MRTEHEMTVALYSHDRRLSELLGLPANAWEMQDALQKIGVLDEQEPFETKLVACSCNAVVRAASDVPVHLYEANMLANCLADMEGADYAILEGLIKIENTRSGKENIPLGKIINMTYNLDNCCMAGNVSNDLELGALALETEHMDIPQEYLPLLSLEALGKQKRETEGGVYVGKYYVMESGDFRYAYHGSPTKPEPMPHFVELDLSGPEDRKMTFKLPDKDFFYKLERDLGVFSSLQIKVNAFRCPLSFRSAEVNDPANLGMVNAFAQTIANLKPQEILKYKAILATKSPKDLESAMQFAKELDQYEFHAEMHSPWDYAKAILDQKMEPHETSELQKHLNMESYGRYLMQRDGMACTSYGILCRNGFGPLMGQEKRQLETLKFYSPLLVQMYPKDDYGNEIDGELEQVSSYDECAYLECIQEAIEKENRSMDPVRGLMEYWNGSQEVMEKVAGVFPAVEEHGNALWGVTTLMTTTPLTSLETNELLSYVLCQYSDGYGEGFEQRPIETSNGDIYVSFWNPFKFEFTPENEFQEGMEQRMGGMRL